MIEEDVEQILEVEQETNEGELEESTSDENNLDSKN